MTGRTVLTVAALTLREAARRRVVWALLVKQEDYRAPVAAMA